MGHTEVLSCPTNNQHVLFSPLLGLPLPYRPVTNWDKEERWALDMKRVWWGDSFDWRFVTQKVDRRNNWKVCIWKTDEIQQLDDKGSHLYSVLSNYSEYACEGARVHCSSLSSHITPSEDTAHACGRGSGGFGFWTLDNDSCKSAWVGNDLWPMTCYRVHLCTIAAHTHTRWIYISNQAYFISSLSYSPALANLLSSPSKQRKGPLWG